MNPSSESDGRGDHFGVRVPRESWQTEGIARTRIGTVETTDLQT